MNFYRTDLRYAVLHEDWIEYDNTGLKGKAATWARENLEQKTLHPNITRVKSNKENIAKWLPKCSKVAYAVGFVPRTLPTKWLGKEYKFEDYDNKTGVIAPNLFGVGIAFPESIVDRKHGH